MPLPMALGIKRRTPDAQPQHSLARHLFALQSLGSLRCSQSRSQLRLPKPPSCRQPRVGVSHDWQRDLQRAWKQHVLRSQQNHLNPPISSSVLLSDVADAIQYASAADRANSLLGCARPTSAIMGAMQSTRRPITCAMDSSPGASSSSL